MLIFRSQGHLLFSDWTISQRTVSGRGGTSFRSCSVVQANPAEASPVVRVGKSTEVFDICKRLLKFFFQPHAHPLLHTRLPGRFKERFSESGCKCKEPFDPCKPCCEKSLRLVKVLLPQQVKPCRCRACGRSTQNRPHGCPSPPRSRVPCIPGKPPEASPYPLTPVQGSCCGYPAP